MAEPESTLDQQLKEQVRTFLAGQGAADIRAQAGEYLRTEGRDDVKKTVGAFAEDAARAAVAAQITRLLWMTGGLSVTAIVAFLYQIFIGLPPMVERAAENRAAEFVLEGEAIRERISTAHKMTSESLSAAQGLTGAMSLLQSQINELSKRFSDAASTDASQDLKRIEALRALSLDKSAVAVLATRVEALANCIASASIKVGDVETGTPYGAASTLGLNSPSKQHFMVGIYDGTGANGIASYNAYREISIEWPDDCRNLGTRERPSK